MFIRFLAPAAWAAAITGFATVGCNDTSRPMAQVTGRVTFQGEVVPEGTITFLPIAGGRPAVGHLHSDGTYELSSFEPGDGAVLGGYRVSIEAKKIESAGRVAKTMADEANQKSPMPAPKMTWIVPESYSLAETSGLEATVEDGANVINFDLP